MKQVWKWKFGAAVLFTLAALWCVLPNLPMFQDPNLWYAKFLPNSKVQLGLDLQGGVQMTLGVDLQRALIHESGKFSHDLREFLEKDSIKVERIDREFSSTEIMVKLDEQADVSKFEDFVTSKFNVMEITSSDRKTKEFKLNITESHKDELERQTIQQALSTLRNRLDEFGVAEPSIQAKGKDKIVVQLPGLAEPERARDILAQTAQLEFLLVDDASLNSLELQKMVEEGTKQLEGKFSADELNYKLKDRLPAGRVILFEQKTDPTTNEVHRTPYLLIQDERISGDLLSDARISTGDFNQPAVSVQFNPEGTSLFAELTKKNVQKRLAIVLDGDVKSAPVLQSYIPNGSAQITLGSYRPRDEMMREATNLAMVLRAGALPAPIEILENRVVGPSLGKDSIEKGLKAMSIGIGLIILFMILYYRFSGFIADLAVIVNVLFIIAILGLLHGTLTLPGLAGILVSVGMAVDANIIIFERIREELTSGKTIKAAVETGYDRAHLTILDSNLTTIITGVVLFEFGTGSIKGFAITLIFGLIANYFTAIWFTKLFYEWLIQKFEPKRLSI